MIFSYAFLVLIVVVLFTSLSVHSEAAAPPPPRLWETFIMGLNSNFSYVESGINGATY